MGSNSTSSTKRVETRRTSHPHRHPKRFLESQDNPFWFPSPLGEKVRTKSSSATPRSFGTRLFSTPEASGHRGNNVNTSPSKVQVEEMTPVGSLFSRPASPAGWEVALGALRKITPSLTFATPARFSQTDPEGAVAVKSPLFSSPTGHGMSENGAGSPVLGYALPPSNNCEASPHGSTRSFEGFNDVGEAQDNQSLDIFDGVGQPQEDHSFEIFDGVGQPQEDWQVASSDDHPHRVMNTSDIEQVEVGVVRVDATFFSNLIFRSFDPVAIPPSNLSALMAYGSRYPTGVNTAAFIRMLWHCIRCDHFVFADNVRLHNCPEAEQLGEPLPEDFDIIEYLTGQGSHGLLQWQLVSVTARCTLCDKLVFQDEGAVRHRCDCGRWQW
ncbi:hypothetical protein BKA70DRAFT_1442158 [Coprinopsis sp. MPI-PUGE-AT-0042]|nr:hypothetical protein BKA70DRAFT_1442158 [Coprinopsis sp. MPI-PUGE-AT-0042]